MYRRVLPTNGTYSWASYVTRSSVSRQHSSHIFYRMVNLRERNWSLSLVHCSAFTIPVSLSFSLSHRRTNKQWPMLPPGKAGLFALQSKNVSLTCQKIFLLALYTLGLVAPSCTDKHFLWKTFVSPLWGTCLRIYTIERKRKRRSENVSVPGGIFTCDLLITRDVLFRCATLTARIAMIKVQVIVSSEFLLKRSDFRVHTF